MIRYEWRGRDAQGEAVAGEIEALTEASAADQLMAMGVAPVHIAVEVVAVKADSWLTRRSRKPVVAEDIMLFSRQMYTLNKAGIPIFQALAGLQASATRPAMIELLQGIRFSLNQGRELSVAMALHQDVFGAFYISMIRVGELTSHLTEVFLSLNEHLEFERDVRERLRQAMRYPFFVLIALLLAVVILNIFVIPVFGKVFASFNAPLPPITRGLLAMSGWMVAWWPALVAMGIGVTVMLRRFVHSPSGRYRWDARKLRLPVVGDIILKAALARFSRSFALTIQSGVPLDKALSVVAQTVDNAFLCARIEQMRDGIKRGGSITRCATAAGIFTPMVLQMMAVGEETGELDALLFEIAAMYERETGYSIKGLAASIEPVLLAIVAALVLLLAIGVFLPLWSLGQAAMGRGGA
ncbi:MAG: type II secretion system F family protein [Polaromonas sp.]|nr:type II secretion system F family protein [Polaromonas sp.]